MTASERCMPGQTHATFFTKVQSGTRRVKPR